MAINYTIDYPCLIRKHISNEQLLAIMNQRAQAMQVLAFTMIEEQKTEEEARQKKIQVRLMDENNNPVDKEVEIGELMSQTDVLEKVKMACVDCPVSKGQDFGCFGSINFPISRKGENYLIDLLENLQKKGLPDSILINVILDNKVSGEKFAKLRTGVKNEHFESPVPYSLKVKKKVLQKTSIDTNQLLSMFFDKDTIDITDLLYIGFFSGALEITEEEPKDLNEATGHFKIKNKEGKDVFYVYRAPIKEEDQSIKDMNNFFYAVFLALSKGSIIKVLWK